MSLRAAASLSPDALHAYVVATCRALGSDALEAGLVADQLVAANLTGHDSHGVGMMPYYVDGALGGQLHLNEHIEIVRDSGPVVVVDGRRGFGQVCAHETMLVAIDRAKEHGVALVGLRNSYHVGRIGQWGEQCARAGLVSIHFVNVCGHDPLVAPYGGREARFTTNPVCIAIPGTDGGPLTMLDMATSQIAMGKARVALNKGEPTPDGAIIDGSGRPTTDPAGLFSEPMTGALTAFGEHKGSGLAIMCELLSAALTGGETVQPGNLRDHSIINHMLSIVIDPDALGGAAHLVTEANAFLDYVRSSAPRHGFDEVLVPGQPEERSRRARATTIPVDPTTLNQLHAAATRAGVPVADVETLLFTA